ncbi:LeoA/HP0731 family dynamin-like GTPase [Acetobacter senegalensis]|uniref:LeoA/HP0731 family dynamin-like GTPase n=1 Tax=Acetobacter senegalensis TaxID=446692 RepID=UPI00264F7F7F|nr:LeoA/HP0731 family dynamin-like GTPase [Acetobacter senegalensis]MDN7351543.1 50S ribosome-binding GTPase [Acetobacter senegalensis]
MSVSADMQKTIDSLHSFLEEGRTLGFEIPPSLSLKLDKVVETIQSDGKLTAALVGGFSEGKTSIAAAWLGEQHTSMKINARESSDKVEVYDAGAQWRIVDTPGLYGHKGGETQAEEIKFKEITRRYVSEANIVLYVMNGLNPLKDSHKEELEWLFRELDLLSRTVFVLGRFDEVADMDDDDEYEKVLRIKKENVTGRLRALIELTDNEVKQLSIVGVSGRPFGKGLAYWKERPEEFAKLSRIDTLQQEVKKKIDALGGADRILDATHSTMLADVLSQPLRQAEKQQFDMENDVRRLGECVTGGQDDAKRIVQRIGEAKTVLKRDIGSKFSAISEAIRSSTKDTLPEVLRKRIGAKSAVIEEALNEACEAELRPIVEEIGKAREQLSAAIGRFSVEDISEENESKGRLVVAAEFTTPSMAEGWLTGLTGHLAKTSPLGAALGDASGAFNEIGTLLASWLSTPAKAGQQSVSFWEYLVGPSAAKVAAAKAASEAAAKNMTRLVGSLAAIANIGITALNEVQEQQAQAAFRQAQNEIFDLLNSAKREAEKSVSAPDFTAKFLPDFEKFKTVLSEINDELTRKKKVLDRCKTWFRHADELHEELHR